MVGVVTFGDAEKNIRVFICWEFESFLPFRIAVIVPVREKRELPPVPDAHVIGFDHRPTVLLARGHAINAHKNERDEIVRKIG